ncbi:hypothetical protein BDFG_06489 [Blastomyces dermatitidis ATCC 26199]|nr:hypothetical protein BDFG_06489 [Blastomyces dermatitidis ATCC 26199]
MQRQCEAHVIASPLSAEIQSFNSLIPSTLPPRLYARQSRAYFVGRSQDAADRIIAECKALNLEGEYIFIQADIRLIRVVDNVCEQIKSKKGERTEHVGSQRGKTCEKIHALPALIYYSRGTREGLLDSTDFPAFGLPLKELRGHLASPVTLGLEAIARMTPDVSFIHGHLGLVDTPIFRHMHGQPGKQSPFEVSVVPIEESGERHLYLATSSRFPARQGNSASVPLPDGTDMSISTTGTIGGGVYSVGSDCETGSPDVKKLLAELRDKGMIEEVWNHTEEEFKRICGSHLNALFLINRYFGTLIFCHSGAGCKADFNQALTNTTKLIVHVNADNAHVTQSRLPEVCSEIAIDEFNTIIQGISFFSDLQTSRVQGNIGWPEQRRFGVIWPINCEVLVGAIDFGSKMFLHLVLPLVYFQKVLRLGGWFFRSTEYPDTENLTVHFMHPSPQNNKTDSVNIVTDSVGYSLFMFNPNSCSSGAAVPQHYT